MRKTTENIDTIINNLALAYTDVQKSHGKQEYDILVQSICLMLKNLRVAPEKIMQIAETATFMYRMSDEADAQLEVKNFHAHDEYFAKIAFLAVSLDRHLKLDKGSIRDQVRWWYHYRLYRKAKYWKEGSVKVYSQFLLTFFFLFLEHIRRLRNLHAITCTYWLVRAGRRHDKRDWRAVQDFMCKYWAAKFAGNKWRVEPKLALF